MDGEDGCGCFVIVIIVVGLVIWGTRDDKKTPEQIKKDAIETKVAADKDAKKKAIDAILDKGGTVLVSTSPDGVKLWAHRGVNDEIVYFSNGGTPNVPNY